jgi:hypothetical protein
MRNQRRLRIGGDFVASDAKARSSGTESAVYSYLNAAVLQLWTRYFAPGDTTVGLGPENKGFGESGIYAI